MQISIKSQLEHSEIAQPLFVLFYKAYNAIQDAGVLHLAKGEWRNLRRI
jgi:hypothetical protein